MSEATAQKKESETKRVRALVDRAQKGDRDALEELYLIHFDRIYGYLHVSVGNRHDAEDLTTQTFLKMLESIGRKSMLELIDDLSPEQQQVLTLKFVFNFANAEAATILGKTEGAIKSLQHRALVSLQKQLEKRNEPT
jgi:DNA-directed RNA polymerase specialized sigma24 family protein